MQYPDHTTIIVKEYSPVEIKGIIKKVDLAVGTSYHFNLFALSSNVPVIGIYQNEYYKQKLEGVLSLFGMGAYCFDFLSAKKSDIIGCINDLLEDHKSVSRELLNRNVLIKEESEKIHILMMKAFKL